MNASEPKPERRRKRKRTAAPKPAPKPEPPPDPDPPLTAAERAALAARGWEPIRGTSWWWPPKGVPGKPGRGAWRDDEVRAWLATRGITVKEGSA